MFLLHWGILHGESIAMAPFRDAPLRSGTLESMRMNLRVWVISQSRLAQVQLRAWLMRIAFLFISPPLGAVFWAILWKHQTNLFIGSTLIYFWPWDLPLNSGSFTRIFEIKASRIILPLWWGGSEVKSLFIVRASLMFGQNPPLLMWRNMKGSEKNFKFHWNVFLS